MVGLLEAIPGTQLYDRLRKENRLKKTPSSGDNADGDTNIIPVMDITVLKWGYRDLMNTFTHPGNTTAE